MRTEFHSLPNDVRDRLIAHSNAVRLAGLQAAGMDVATAVSQVVGETKRTHVRWHLLDNYFAAPAQWKPGIMAALHLLDAPPDPRYNPFRYALRDYWHLLNGKETDMPWDAQDERAFADYLAADPDMSDVAFRIALSIRAARIKPGDEADRVCMWLAGLGATQPKQEYPLPPFTVHTADGTELRTQEEIEAHLASADEQP